MAKKTRGIGLQKKLKAANMPSTNHLLVIGIDDYSNGIRTLNNAVKDAKAFEKLVQERYSFDEENTIALYDKEATAENILGAFDRLRKQLTNDDNLIIYFSGHGELVKASQRGYWIPVEAHNGKRSSYLNNIEVSDFIKTCKARHVLGIIDACYSGSLLRKMNRDVIDKYYRKPSRKLMTSGLLEPVPDGLRNYHSPFAKALLTVLEYNTKPYLSAEDLWYEMKAGLASNTDATAVFEPMNGVGHQGGDFFFIRKDAAEIPDIEASESSPNETGTSRGATVENSKNVVTESTINAGANVIIGDNNVINPPPASESEEDFNLGEGKLLYDIPNYMKTGIVSKCKVRIAADRKILLEDIKVTADAIIKDLRKITKVMSVELMDVTGGENFTIVDGSSEDQIIEKEYYTEWTFFVTPLKTGEHQLLLRLSAIQLINDKERKKDITFSETVTVVADKDTINQVTSIKTAANLKKALRKLLAQQKTKAAYELLIEKLDEDSSHTTTAYLRLANLNGLERDIAAGIATNVPQQRAQINHALDYIINNLTDADIAK